MSSMQSYLTCNLQAPRRGGSGGVAGEVDPYDEPQPQTATCCTALQRGVAPDGLAQPRYAPLRTTPPMLAAGDDGESSDDDRHSSSGNKETTTSINSKQQHKSGKLKPPAVRKCKSTVADVHASHLIQGPRLRRCGGMRRDWSFEDVHNAA